MKLLTLFFLLPLTLFSQRITIDSTNSNYPFVRRNMNQFEYLHDNLDSMDYVWIADLTYHYDSLGRDTINTSIYDDLGNKALELGANSFKIVSWNRLSKSEVATIKVYKLKDGKRQKNLDLFRENKVYFFGISSCTTKRQTYTLEINNVKVTIKPFTYKEYTLGEGEKMMVKYKGKKVTLIGKKNAMNKLFSLNYSVLGYNSKKMNIYGLKCENFRAHYNLKIYDKD